MTRDRDLEQRIEQVLAELSTLSEVAAAKIGRSSASSDESRGIPAGIDPTPRRRDPDRPPSKDRSLFDWYVWQFARARTDQLRRVLLFMAEGDLKARRWSSPEASSGSLGAAAQMGEKRDERILTWYEGTHPLEAAMLESHHGGYCSEESVRAVRRQARRSELDGRPLPGWAGWDDETRKKRVGELLRRGKSLGAIAIELGTAKSNVQRVVSRLRGRKAA